MDARTIYNLMKPHLNGLDFSEKKALAKLISSLPPQRVSCQHKKVISLKRAKEKLRLNCRRAMQLEKMERQSESI